MISSDRQRPSATWSRAALAAACVAVIGCSVPDRTRAGGAWPFVPDLAGPTAAEEYGTVALRVNWPRTISAIPASARLLVVSVTGASGVSLAQVRIPRPEPGAGGASDARFRVRAGRGLTIVVRAYRDAEVSDAQMYHVPSVALGVATGVDIYANAVTPVALDLAYHSIRADGFDPTNGGEGTLVILTGSGFDGFVDALHATPSFQAFFSRYPVASDSLPPQPGRIPGVSDASRQDRWLPVPGGEVVRSSENLVYLLVPAGAVSGPIEYRVDGIPATWAQPRPTFTVLRDLQIVKEGNLFGEATASFLVGATQSYAALATDTGGQPFDSPTVSWRSSNPLVGSVDQAGLFTASIPGSTIVSIASGRLLASVSIQVYRTLPPPRQPDFNSTASFDIPLPDTGSSVSFDFPFPDFDGGLLSGVGTP